jgi:hypothetical protein
MSKLMQKCHFIDDENRRWKIDENRPKNDPLKNDQKRAKIWFAMGGSKMTKIDQIWPGGSGGAKL